MFVLAPLLTWLTSAASTALAYFGYQVATRTAFYIAAAAATVAIFVALASLCTGLITGFTSALSTNVLVQGIGLFLPSNTSLCVSAYLSASFAKWMARIGLIHVLIASRV